MTLNTDRQKAYITSLLDLVEKEGVAALSEDQKRYLGRLLVGDIRKGEFHVDDREDKELLKDFCAHVRKSYIDDEYLVAIDFRNDLEHHAKKLSQESYPISSLILYATLVEHWVNGVIAALAIRNGISPADIKAVLRNVPLKGKLSWMLQIIGVPDLDRNHRKAMEKLVEWRNSYLHYKWTGKSFEHIDEEDSSLQEFLNEFLVTTSYMREYEDRYLSGEALAVCKRLFGIENPFGK